MVTSAWRVSASSCRTSSQVPDSMQAWLTDAGHQIGRAHGKGRRSRRRGRRSRRPDRRARAAHNRTAPGTRSLSASIVGNRAMAGRLSVCPPESASTVISCAIGICVGQLGLLGGQHRRLATSSRSKLLRRRRQETGGHLLAGDLGDDPVGGDDAPVGIADGCRGAVAHQRQGQSEKGRGLDQAHAAPQIKFDQGMFPDPAHWGCGSD